MHTGTLPEQTPIRAPRAARCRRPGPRARISPAALTRSQTRQWRQPALAVDAKALAAALDVFARPDIQGLARLQDRVDLLLDHVEHHSGLRRAAVHLLGIGTAAEFAFANHPRRVELVG